MDLSIIDPILQLRTLNPHQPPRFDAEIPPPLPPRPLFQHRFPANARRQASTLPRVPPRNEPAGRRRQTNRKPLLVPAGFELGLFQHGRAAGVFAREHGFPVGARFRHEEALEGRPQAGPCLSVVAQAEELGAELEAVEEFEEESGFQGSDGHVSASFALVYVVPGTAAVEKVFAARVVPEGRFPRVSRHGR